MKQNSIKHYQPTSQLWLCSINQHWAITWHQPVSCRSSAGVWSISSAHPATGFWPSSRMPIYLWKWPQHQEWENARTAIRSARSTWTNNPTLKYSLPVWYLARNSASQTDGMMNLSWLSTVRLRRQYFVRHAGTFLTATLSTLLWEMDFGIRNTSVKHAFIMLVARRTQLYLVS